MAEDYESDGTSMKIANEILFESNGQWRKLFIYENNDDQELVLAPIDFNEKYLSRVNQKLFFGPFTRVELKSAIDQEYSCSILSETLKIRNEDYEISIKAGVLSSVLFSIEHHIN